jgi:hypothetical protein
MTRAAESRVLDAWYDRLDADQVAAWVRAERDARHAADRQVKRTDEMIAKARTRDSMRAFSKLVQNIDGRLQIVADPPLVVPIEDLRPAGRTHEEDVEAIQRILRDYQATLPGARHPVAEFTYMHMARKVVGVGSVGTRAWIVLLRGRDDDDPLLLQAKQAEASVLERFLRPSEYALHGERVTGHDGIARDFYLRQLHDWKGGVDPEVMVPAGAKLYAQVCGETLARAHARSGDRVAIAAYLGSSDRLDRALAEFASDYADQNERDYAAFAEAVASGRLPAAELV